MEDKQIIELYWNRLENVWNVIPPHKPQSLRAFLGKITRNQALHIWEKKQAKKRKADSVSIALEELSDCIPGSDSVEQITEHMVLVDVLNQFLGELAPAHRNIFIARYWYFASIKEIASKYDMSESKVKMTLSRSRQKLKEILEKEGIVL